MPKGILRKRKQTNSNYELQEEPTLKRLTCKQCKQETDALNEDGICTICVNSNSIQEEIITKGEETPNDEKPLPIKLILGFLLGVIVIVGIIYALVGTPPELDNEPNQFTFLKQKDTPLNTEIISNNVTISGLTSTTKVKIKNGLYSINGGAWTANNGTIENNSDIKIKHTSSNQASSLVKTEVTVGNMTQVFISQTAGCSERDKALVRCRE